jgi:VanZ family protein
MRELRYRKLWLAIGFVLVALVVFLSLTPKPLDVGRFEGVNVGHLLAYGSLMLWFAQIFRSGRGRIGVGIALVLLGVALEYAQLMTGYRSFAYADMRDNAIGVAAGLAVSITRLGGILAVFDAWLAGQRGQVGIPGGKA